MRAVLPHDTVTTYHNEPLKVETVRHSYLLSSYAVVTCETKLFRNYFRSLLQLVNIFEQVQ